MMHNHSRNRHLVRLGLESPPSLEKGAQLPPITPAPRRDASQSYTPAISSPLNPASPATSSKSSSSSQSSTYTPRNRTSADPSNPRDSPRWETSHSTGVSDRESSQPPPVPPPRNHRRLAIELQGPGSWNPSRIERRPVPMTVTDLGHDYSRYPVSQMPRWKRAALSGPLSGPRTTLRNPSHSTTDSSSWSPASPDSVRESETTDKFSSFLDDRITAPTPHPLGYSFPTRLEEKEADDDMHMPSPDDDRTYKVTLRQCLRREGLVSMLGFIVMTAGLFVIFVLVPILLFTGVAHRSRKAPPLNLDFHVNDVVYPLMQNIRIGLIDPRTPSEAFTRPSVEGGSPLKLVFSDEFSTPGRTFYPGDDPYWTAPDFWYGATQDLDWYDPDAVTTASGTLNLRLDRFASHNLTFRSGMLNSWNQLCFKGGALEVSVSLPGPPRVPGFWPGVWTMGNLGRPGYRASTDGVWPYTYSTCDVGITPNQSSPDGISFLPGQRLPSCTCPNEDHPSPGTGRGAPEIDVLEGGVDPENRLGIVTQSYQVAPYDVWYQPNYDFFEIPNPNLTQMNAYRGGPYQQAISGVTTLNHDWYDGVQYQRYAFEYRPGTSPRSHISWFVGDEHSYRMTAESIGPNGNIGQREISEEPMSIILNLGISDSWTWIDWPELTFPTQMRIDYVRLYQEEGTENGLTCDPPGWETTEYIAQHPLAYDNPNLTHWDNTSYHWPKHHLNSDCASTTKSSSKNAPRRV